MPVIHAAAEVFHLSPIFERRHNDRIIPLPVQPLPFQHVQLWRHERALVLPTSWPSSTLPPQRVLSASWPLLQWRLPLLMYD